MNNKDTQSLMKFLNGQVDPKQFDASILIRFIEENNIQPLDVETTFCEYIDMVYKDDKFFEDYGVYPSAALKAVGLFESTLEYYRDSHLHKNHIIRIGDKYYDVYQIKEQIIANALKAATRAAKDAVNKGETS